MFLLMQRGTSLCLSGKLLPLQVIVFPLIFISLYRVLPYHLISSFWVMCPTTRVGRCGSYGLLVYLATGSISPSTPSGDWCRKQHQESFGIMWSRCPGTACSPTARWYPPWVTLRIRVFITVLLWLRPIRKIPISSWIQIQRPVILWITFILERLAV